MDFQLTLSANSKVDTENTLRVSKLGACAAGTVTRGVGKIGPLEPLPLAQSAARSMGIPVRATSKIHTYIHTCLLCCVVSSLVSDFSFFSQL